MRALHPPPARVGGEGAQDRAVALSIGFHLLVIGLGSRVEGHQQARGQHRPGPGKLAEERCFRVGLELGGNDLVEVGHEPLHPPELVHQHAALAHGHLDHGRGGRAGSI